MPKKILIIIPSLRSGGAERILINIINQIDFSEYKIDLLVGVHAGPLFNDVPREVNIKILFPIPLLAKISSYLYRKFGFLFLFKLFSKKVGGHYDAGISFLDGPFSELLFHNNATINKKIAIIHSSYSSFHNVKDAVQSSHFNRMKKRYTSLDTIISVSYESMREFTDLFGTYNDMRVIYNPINVKQVILKSKESSILKEQSNNLFKIVAVGSLVHVKGFDRLVEAAYLLKNDGYRFTIQIVGEGEDRTKLSHIIETKRLNDCVELVGYKNNPYVYIQSSDLFVMTSHSEGLPTVLCEAMVLEKPVLVTNVTGCREVINEGEFGMMVDNNSKAIYQGIKKFLDDKKLIEYYSLKSKERKNVFDDAKAIEAYTTLFNGK